MTDNSPIILKRGEKGYWPMMTGETPENFNRKLNITPAQKQAMEYGSMFGWNSPAANPENYDSDGNPVKTKYSN